MNDRPVVTYIALGANLGDRWANMKNALAALHADDCVNILAVSPMYETKPVGGPPGQPDYLNAVARAATTLSPENLLALTQGIETALGRVRRIQNDARAIDLDILLYGTLHRSHPPPVVPHPRMRRRAFVLQPLADLNPALTLPTSQTPISELLASLDDHSLSPVNDASWWVP